jgi:integrase
LLSDITRREVRGFELKLRAAGLSEINIRKHVRILSSVLSEAVEDELIESNPVLGRGRGRHRSKAKGGASKPRVDPFDGAELTKLFETCRTHVAKRGGEPQFGRFFPFLFTVARVGLRLGEALALRWGDVDWQDGTILIQRSITRGVIDVPKGGKFRRVDMTDELRRVLRAEYDLRFARVVSMDAEAEAVKRGEALDALLFPDQGGGILDESNLRRRVWKPLLAAAELRHRRLHDLRHSYASLLLQDGAELLYVSQQLGHHTASFTLDVYGHLMPRDRRHVANRLDTLAPQSVDERVAAAGNAHSGTVSTGDAASSLSRAIVN